MASHKSSLRPALSAQTTCAFTSDAVIANVQQSEEQEGETPTGIEQHLLWGMGLRALYGARRLHRRHHRHAHPHLETAKDLMRSIITTRNDQLLRGQGKRR